MLKLGSSAAVVRALSALALALKPASFSDIFYSTGTDDIKCSEAAMEVLRRESGALAGIGRYLAKMTSTMAFR